MSAKPSTGKRRRIYRGMSTTAANGRGSEALTAGELIERLAHLDPHTVISWTDWDSDHDTTFVYGIAGVDEDGQVDPSRILNSWHGMDPDDTAAWSANPDSSVAQALIGDEPWPDLLDASPHLPC